MEKYNGTLALIANQEPAMGYRIGLINKIENDQGARLTFSDFSAGSYPLSKVMILKDKNELYQQLLTSANQINTQDFKTLLSVNMLQEKGSLHALISALEMLKNNPSAALIALEPLSMKFSLANKASLSQDEFSQKHSR